MFLWVPATKSGIPFSSFAIFSLNSASSLFLLADAGTEVNSEAAGTMPGPADGGEGFNATRTDTGYVAMHPGVVTVDDGLTNSVLTVQHKFDNPAVRIMVTRIE